MKKYKILEVATRIETILTEQEFRDWYTFNKMNRGHIYASRLQKEIKSCKGYRLMEIIEENSTIEPNRVKEVIEEVQGKMERKPKMVEVEKGYEVFWGEDNRTFVSFEDQEKIMKLYCSKEGHTIDQMAVIMGMERQEFYAVKSALEIFKHGIPYPDRKFNECEVEKLVEETIHDKKKLYLKRLPEKKVENMESELKQLRQKEYYYNILSESMKDIKIENNFYNLNPFKETKFDKHEAILHLTDWHGGDKTDNYYNQYNISIMKDRVERLTKEAYENVKLYDISKLYIVITGDMINGIIHNSTRMLSDLNVVESVKEVAKVLTSSIVTLSNYCEIDVSFVHGNHGRIQQEKNDNTDDENFEEFILMFLEVYLASFGNVKVNKKTVGNVIRKSTKYCNFIAHHGDKTTCEKLIDNSDAGLDLVLMGHHHTFEEKTYKRVKIIKTGSLMGSNNYAAEKELIDRAQQTMIILFDKKRYMTIQIFLD